jgi:Mg/Co/Ni transporter MgtE
MSTKAKGVTIDKIVSLFDRVDLDDAVNLFNQLKSHLSAKLLEKAKDHEEKSSELLSVAEKINGK